MTLWENIFSQRTTYKVEMILSHSRYYGNLSVYMRDGSICAPAWFRSNGVWAFT